SNSMLKTGRTGHHIDMPKGNLGTRKEIRAQGRNLSLWEQVLRTTHTTSAMILRSALSRNSVIRVNSSTWFGTRRRGVRIPSPPTIFSTTCDFEILLGHP